MIVAAVTCLTAFAGVGPPAFWRLPAREDRSWVTCMCQSREWLIGSVVSNGEVRLHVVDSGGAAEGSGRPPVLVIPGMGERAEEYTWLLDRLGDRRVVLADLRGRGGSDAPESGYTWEDHVGDIRAVVEACGLAAPVMVAFSRGSSYALGYALRYPGEVAGLVIGDYMARHAVVAEEHAAAFLRSRIRGVPVDQRMAERVVRRVFAESREVPLGGRLGELRCPVLLVRGGARGAVVTDEEAERWRGYLPSVEVATVAGAGHDLWGRDRDAYLAVLLPFLHRITATTTTTATTAAATDPALSGQ